MANDPYVDQYINSILTAQNSAQQQPTTVTDKNGNVTSTPYSGPTKYIASDGAQFTDVAQYRFYQTQLDQLQHQTRTTQALAQARLQAQQAVTAQGLDYSQYSPQIEAQIQSILGIIPEFDQNPGTYFDPNLADNVLSGIQNTDRMNYKGQVNSTFNPTYDTTRLPDSTLQSSISDILGTQYGTAQEALDRGKARGQYNDVGYNAGEANLQQQRTGVNASLSTTASDILNGYRDKLDTVRNNAYGAATSYDLGDNFNLGDYTSQADDIVNQATTRAPGELINNVGKQPLFDLSSLINAGGQAQGSQNLNNLDVADALAKRRKENDLSRGLGSQGSF